VTEPLSFLVLTDLPLDPQRSASQLRLGQLFQLILRAGHALAYGCLFGGDRPHSAFLQELRAAHPRLTLLGAFAGAPAGIDVVYLTNLWASETLQAGLAALERARAASPRAVVVYDALDCLHRGIGQFLVPAARAELTGLEARLHRSADFSVMVSPLERERLIGAFGLGADRVGVVSMAFPLYAAGLAAGFDGRRDLCFVGVPHPSNLHGLQHFIREILPAVAARVADAEFHIIGAGTERLQIRLPRALAPRLKVLGFIPDLEAAIARYRVQVVPLLGGGGIKGKLLQSLACGTPVVATPQAIAGMTLVAGRDLAVAEPPAFADAVAAVYADAARWQELQEGGRRYVEENFSQAGLEAQWSELVDTLRRRRAERA